MAGVKEAASQSADARQVAWRQTEPGCGDWLAIRAAPPLGLANPERLEQSLAREVVQLPSRSLLDQPAQERRRTAIISPVPTRSIDHRPLQHVAVAICGVVHGGFAVSWIGIGKGEFVPIRAERHGQRVLDRQGVFFRVRRQVGIFRKLCEETGFRRWHLAGGEGDAIQQTDHALRHGAHIMQCLGSKPYNAQWTAPCIGACKIPLEEYPTATRRYHAM
jgi:hypothetical protein